MALRHHSLPLSGPLSLLRAFQVAMATAAAQALSSCHSQRSSCQVPSVHAQRIQAFLPRGCVTGGPLLASAGRGHILVVSVLVGPKSRRLCGTCPEGATSHLTHPRGVSCVWSPLAPGLQAGKRPCPPPGRVLREKVEQFVRGSPRSPVPRNGWRLLPGAEGLFWIQLSDRWQGIRFLWRR